MKREVMIITDSTNDLPPALLQELGVVVLPLSVAFGEEIYRDGVDMNVYELYDKVAQTNMLPKTAAIPPGELLACFQKFINLGKDILFTGISSFMSRTYENAVLVSKELPENRIRIVDSQNLSTGIGLLVLKACKFKSKGLSLLEIEEKLVQIVPKIRSQFVIETMDYLHKGGRCSGVAKFFGTMLKIKPIIVVRDGTMSVGKKPRGKMRVALDEMLKMIRADKNNLDFDQILVTHSVAFESKDYLVESLQKEFPGVKIIDSVAGCVISSHCGRGTIGILYILKENNR